MNETGLDIDESFESALRETVEIADDPLWIRPPAIRTRIASVIFGAIMPVVLLLLSGSSHATVDQPWQSGHLSMYVGMLFKPSALIWFFPWIAFSMASLITWAWSPRNARNPWVRLGLSTGCIVAMQYWVLLLIAQGPVSPIVTTVLVVAYYVSKWTISFLYKNYKRFQIWHIFVLMTLVAVLAAFTRLDHLLPMVFGLPFLFPFMMIAATPTLNAIVYLYVAWLAFSVPRHSDHERQSLVAWASVPWVVGWFGSWRMAVQAMLDEYSRLPTSNPNCYFANAAAVASHWLTRQGPDVEMRNQPITLTMQRLKFLELVTMVTCPSTHRVVRKSYDAIGKPAADYCRHHRWLANLSLIAVKPLELAAEALRIVAGISPERIRQIYR